MRPQPPEGGGTRAGLHSIVEGLGFLRGKRVLVSTFAIDINAMYDESKFFHMTLMLIGGAVASTRTIGVTQLETTADFHAAYARIGQPLYAYAARIANVLIDRIGWDGLLWVLSRVGRGDTYSYSLPDLKPLGGAELSGKGAGWVTLTPDGKRAYVANPVTDNVSVVDIATRKRLATIAVGEEPEGVKVSPDGKRVYVTSEVANMVHAIDTASGKVTAINNTGNESGEKCTVNNPCEVDESGAELHRRAVGEIRFDPPAAAGAQHVALEPVSDFLRKIVRRIFEHELRCADAGREKRRTPLPRWMCFVREPIAVFA